MQWNSRNEWELGNVGPVHGVQNEDAPNAGHMLHCNFAMQVAGTGAGNPAGGRHANGAQPGPAAAAPAAAAGGEAVAGGQGSDHFFHDQREPSAQVLRVRATCRAPMAVVHLLVLNLNSTIRRVDVQLGVRLDGVEQEGGGRTELHITATSSTVHARLPHAATNPWVGRLVTGWGVKTGADRSTPHRTLHLTTPTPEQHTALLAEWGEAALTPPHP